jgi:hypothetical protein
MAKVNIYVPEPKELYTVENFRQINRALTTLQNQLNTSFLQDVKQEVDRHIWFNMRSGGC